MEAKSGSILFHSFLDFENWAVTQKEGAHMAPNRIEQLSIIIYGMSGYMSDDTNLCWLCGKRIRTKEAITIPHKSGKFCCEDHARLYHTPFILEENEPW